MITLRFCVYEHTHNAGDIVSSPPLPSAEHSHNAIWFTPKDTGIPIGEVGAGSGQYALGTDLPNAIGHGDHTLRFEITRAQDAQETAHGGTLRASQEFTWPTQKAILRLDQVTFPAQAIAYRHIHAGAGFRYLLTGGLGIDTGDHQQLMQPDDIWFEDINSPVRATAMDGCVSQFIRAMIVPLEFHGKSTINILDADDAAKPSLQSNHRFIDEIITL